MASATATIHTTVSMRVPSHRQRKLAQKLARLQRATRVYARAEPPVANDEYAWYVRWLSYEYPAYTGW